MCVSGTATAAEFLKWKNMCVGGTATAPEFENGRIYA